MRRIVLLLAAASSTGAQTAPRAAADIRLDPTTRLELHNGRTEWVDYRGRRALKLAPLAGQEQGTDQEIWAVIAGSDFQDGVIEVDVSGARRAGYATDNASAFKGFVGISFRVRGDTGERFYIRPENARLDDQLFRNRSTQYEATPDHPWQRLRQESPGMYESYADMEAGGWTRLRIEVSGTSARLFINGASQPSLVVNDLRLGVSRGAIALWTRISSDAYFANLRVERRAMTTPKLPAIGTVINGRTEVTTHRGLEAIKLVPLAAVAAKDTDMMAVLDRPDFRNGTIELMVSGAPRPGTPPDSRGFIGIGFRTGARGEWSEVFYLRPTNGRANDQLRRNHSLQYVSHPEYTWNRLRSESPGVYESNADMEAGVWTAVKIVVAGATARLYVNGAAEPSLVVNDLKRGDVAGRIALWAHVETDAYFSPITIVDR